MLSRQASSRRNLRDLFSRDNSRSSLTGGDKNNRQLSSATVTSTAASSGDEVQSRPTSPVRSRVSRHVTFADPLCENDTDNSDDEHQPLSEEERRAYFYNVRDLAGFEKDMALTALMYINRKEQGIPWEENEYTIRGVEELLKSRDIKSVRAEHAKLVVNEQNNLEQSTRSARRGENPMERLRTAACQSSKSDRLRAMHRARQDAVFAGRYNATNNSNRFTMKRVLSSLSMAK